MWLNELTFAAKDFLNQELKDGYGESGGISYQGYTLDDYLHEISNNEEEYQEYLKMDMYDINNMLVTESGIAAIPYRFERERIQQACLTAYYVGLLDEEQGIGMDSIVVMQKCIDWANNLNFQMEYDDKLDSFVIDSDWARNVAIHYAKTIIKEYSEEYPEM